MDLDLLAAPLLSWRDPKRRRGRTTLPGLLARLAAGDVGDFPRVRPHQFHPWSMFLTQLAAIALHRAGGQDPRLSEDEWRELLLSLTGGTREPWTLVIDDLDRPAFFQPPVPEGTLDNWPAEEYPDVIDILVTAKGHDVKEALIGGDDVEAWIYALVTLQTMQGYPGRSHKRIARMKRGYGNRPRVGLSRDQSVTSRFTRDVKVLLTSWQALVERGYRDAGVALVWTEPWDGSSSLAMSDLAPHFIEVCRLVRCVRKGSRVSCHYKTTQVRRCLPELDNGDVGDPWIPIERDEGALSVGRRGFHYELLARLMFSNDFEPAAAQAPREGDTDPMVFIATALVRGKGKTDGLHERAIMLPRRVRLQLGRATLQAAIGKRAAARVESSQRMRSKVLFPAVKVLAPGRTLETDFDARVDEVFFDHLFATLAIEDDQAQLAWDQELRDKAWRELQQTIRRCSVVTGRRFKAISDAERAFRACFRRRFPDLWAAASASEGTAS